jgi:hypothetical protein
MAIEVRPWFIPVGKQPEVMHMQRFVKEWEMNDNPKKEYEDSQYHRTDSKGEGKLVNAPCNFVSIDFRHGFPSLISDWSDSLPVI